MIQAEEMIFEGGSAIVIGVDTYLHSPESTVPPAALDAGAVRDVLRDPGFCGYRDQRITYLIGKEATQIGISDALTAARSVAAGDTLLFFYSGHGAFDKDGNYHLSTQEAIFKDRKIVAGSGISESKLLDYLRAIPAKRILLLINACHSAALDTSFGPEEPEFGVDNAGLPDAVSHNIRDTGEGRVIITSSRGVQKSWGAAMDRPSLFGQAVVDGLRGGEGVRSNAGWIEVNDLYKFVYKEVKAAAKAIHKVQEPVLDVRKLVGDFMVAYYRGGSQEIGLEKELGEVLQFIEDGRKSAAIAKMSELKTSATNLPASALSHSLGYIEELLSLMQGKVSPGFDLRDLARARPRALSAALKEGLQVDLCMAEHLRDQVQNLDLERFPQESRDLLVDLFFQIRPNTDSPVHWPPRPSSKKLVEEINGDNFKNFVFIHDHADNRDETTALFNQDSGLFYQDHPLYALLARQRGLGWVVSEPGMGRTALASALGGFMGTPNEFGCYLRGQPDKKTIRETIAQRLQEYIRLNIFRLNLNESTRSLLANVLVSVLDPSAILSLVDAALQQPFDVHPASQPKAFDRSLGVLFRQVLVDSRNHPIPVRKKHWLGDLYQCVRALGFERFRLVLDIDVQNTTQFPKKIYRQAQDWNAAGIDTLVFLPAELYARASASTTEMVSPVFRLSWEKGSGNDHLISLLKWRFKQTLFLTPRPGHLSAEINQYPEVMRIIKSELDGENRSPRKLAQLWQKHFPRIS